MRDHDDAVVNCNVLVALRELGVPASADETDAVLRLVQASEAGARYYCSPTTIAYAACRAGLPIDLLPAWLTTQPSPEGGILPMAQWLSFARRWDGDAAAHVLAAQVRDGSWPTEAWFTGVAKPRPVWGSPAISTALCVEALQHALAAQSN